MQPSHRLSLSSMKQAAKKSSFRRNLSRRIEGFVKDALAPDSRILECHDFSVTFEDDEAHIEFTADTIFGEIEIEEVI